MKITPKVPAEIIPVTFDFADIALTVDSIAQIGIAVITGTDPASAAMILGSPTLTGSTITQLIRNGVAGVKYRLFCLVNIGVEKYQIDGDMECREWHTK